MNMDWVELPMSDCGFYRRLRRSRQASWLLARSSDAHGALKCWFTKITRLLEHQRARGEGHRTKGFEATVRARLIFMVCASTSHFCATGRSAQHPISALR
jgi:hypothetical protein